MKTGLLWYDGDPKRPLVAKVRRGCLAYHAKYDQWPNTCHVHPGALEEETQVTVKTSNGSGPVEVRLLPNPTTLPAHLWLGCEEA